MTLPAANQEESLATYGPLNLRLDECTLTGATSVAANY